MNITLIGYGKMGKVIEEIALERGHKISSRLTSASSEKDWEGLKAADVCIEFTRPEAALSNFRRCLEMDVPVVVGTTGWYAHMDEVKTQVGQHGGSFFWASNFSIGVNLFWQVNKKLAAWMSRHPEYQAAITEIHHLQKLDAPSGTAITTANQIVENHSVYKQWKLTPGTTGQSVLPITAVREGDVKGTHIVSYESEVDRIELRHEAKSRKGFALGAVMAAEWLQGRKGFFTMDDMLKL